ncbi:MAG: DUF433 domain-containing protein [Thermomicrobiales bacterium]
MVNRPDQIVDYHVRIVIDPAILSGKPVIAGTRIPVSLILNLLAHGYDFERIVDAYPNLSQDDIKAALAYAQARMDREELLPLVGRA